jgi:hypothetical protein
MASPQHDDSTDEAVIPAASTSSEQAAFLRRNAYPAIETPGRFGAILSHFQRGTKSPFIAAFGTNGTCGRRGRHEHDAHASVGETTRLYEIL